MSISGANWLDCQVMARGESGAEGQHPRLCHHQRAHLPLKYGKYQRRAHQRWYATGRTARQTEPDCHPADAGAGGQ